MADKDTEKPNPVESELPDAEKQTAPASDDVREEVKEVLTAEQEAEKRGISVEQWQDVLHLIENAKKVDRDIFPEAEDLVLANFEFDGNGNIIVPGDFSLDDSTTTHLPKNLKVKGSLSLTSSEGLLALPEGLEVETFIELSFCDGMDEEKTLPYLFEMILAGKLNGAVLTSWNGALIKSKLPDGLHMDEVCANIVYKDKAILEDGYVAYKLEEAEMMMGN